MISFRETGEDLMRLIKVYGINYTARRRLLRAISRL